MDKAGRIGSFRFLKSQQWCSSNLSLRFDAGSGLDPSRVNYSPIFGDKPVKKLKQSVPQSGTVALKWLSTLLGLPSRFGEKPVKFQVMYPQLPRKRDCSPNRVVRTVSGSSRGKACVDFKNRDSKAILAMVQVEWPIPYPSCCGVPAVS